MVLAARGRLQRRPTRPRPGRARGQGAWREEPDLPDQGGPCAIRWPHLPVARRPLGGATAHADGQGGRR
eukprot:14245133-Heterocapsa_arctica.AAC.1